MSITKKIGGNIHKIREFELEKVVLMDEFDVLQIVGEGWFGKILLVEHKATDTEMVLKALPKPYVSVNDFYREFHYGLHLSSHRNIVRAFDVAFETAGFYVFTQEYAPLGDLTSNVSETGIGEIGAKRIAKQIAAALDYIHSKEIVHRDIKLDNVLVFKSDFSRVKLCDFGESRRCGCTVQRRNEWLPYSPPEIISLQTDENYIADSSHDIWQFAIVIFICLTGCLPWQKAELDDPRYNRYVTWFNSAVFPIRRLPKLFKLISTKACKMFKKFLDPRPSQRVKTLSELNKYLDDRWLGRHAEKEFLASEPDELSPSMYSFHSDVESKSKLLKSLSQYGVETHVNREDKKRRIRDWIQSSVIEEDNDEEEESDYVDDSILHRAPIPGHISSLQAAKPAPKIIKTSTKDASHKHIDPRTGKLQEGPSKMGSAYDSKYNVSDDNEPHSNGNRAIIKSSNGQTESVLLQSIDSFSISTNDSNDSSGRSIETQNKLNQPSSSGSRSLQSTFHSIATVLVPETVKSNGSPKYYKRSQTSPSITKLSQPTVKKLSMNNISYNIEKPMKDTAYDRIKKDTI